MCTSVDDGGGAAALACALLKLAEARAPERITVAELFGVLGDRGAAVLILLLALPTVILRDDGRWVLAGLLVGLASIALLGGAVYGLTQLELGGARLSSP